MRNLLSKFGPAASYCTLAASLFYLFVGCQQWRGTTNSLRGRFEDPSELESDWVEVISGDFSEAKVDIIDSPLNGKLRIRANTLGTESKTVKFLGIRSRESFNHQDTLLISWVLDWNEQSNGSYLSAGLLLSPHAAKDHRPTDELDWLQVSYVGVPPGKNARLEITGRFSGNQKTLFNEGWPTRNRLGRRIGLQNLKLHFSDTGLELKENGKSVFRSDQNLNFEKIYVYLFLTSHSNYGPREVYFDNIEVKNKM